MYPKGGGGRGGSTRKRGRVSALPEGGRGYGGVPEIRGMVMESEYLKEGEGMGGIPEGGEGEGGGAAVISYHPKSTRV